jgi:hypothetical protein
MMVNVNGVQRAACDQDSYFLGSQTRKMNGELIKLVAPAIGGACMALHHCETPN